MMKCPGDVMDCAPAIVARAYHRPGLKAAKFYRGREPAFSAFALASAWATEQVSVSVSVSDTNFPSRKSVSDTNFPKIGV
jgi:hypothetical protein